MPLDELAVNAGDLYLSQVDAGAGMVLQPGDDRQQEGPLPGQLQGAQGAFLEPGKEFGETLPSQGHLGGETLGLPASGRSWPGHRSRESIQTSAGTAFSPRMR